MGIYKSFTLFFLLLVALSIYLFVSAPPPLANEKPMGLSIPVEEVLILLDQENQLVRNLYTKEIVGDGKKQKLLFDENWDERHVFAGLLPAQFLRETARSIERSKVKLGLYLGSDYAINQANQLEGMQLRTFKQIKRDRKAKFLYIEEARRYVYMAPDIATVKPCVTCHNDHKESPKDDWKIDDVMGVTTWTYPKKEVPIEEVLLLVEALHEGIKSAYQNLITEMEAMEKPPLIGKRWPKEGYFIPDADEFMREVNQRTAKITFSQLIQMVANISAKEVSSL